MIKFFIPCILAMLFCEAMQSEPDPTYKWKDILKLGSEYDKRIEFFTRSNCLYGINNQAGVDRPTVEMLLNRPFGKYVDRDTTDCYDTIGFLPLTKNKLQMFVIAEKKTDINKKNAMRKIEIKLKTGDNDETVLTCTETGKVTPGNPKAFSVELSPNSDTLLKNPDISIVQCPGVYLTANIDNKSIYDILKDGEWTFKVTYCCDNDNKEAECVENPTLKECETKINGRFDKIWENIISKKFCEFDRLKLSNHDDKHKTYVELTRETGKLDIIRKSDDSLFSGKSRVTNDACTSNDGYSMKYTISKEGDTQSRTGLAKVVDCSEKENKYFYAITPLNEPTNIDVADDEHIELECSQYKCRTCEKPLNVTCPSDTGSCTNLNSVNKHTNANEYAECYELDTTTCKSGIVLLNGKIEKIFESDAKSVKCNDDSKFKLNNQIITHVSCLGTYSAVKYPLKNSTNLENNELKTKDPVNCAKPGTGCQCDTNKWPEFNNLAFANKNGTDWLRIESLIFNFNIGVYEYNRTHENKQTNFHTFNPERVVQCIPAVALPRKEDAPKNPAASMVIGANIGIIVALAAIAVPGVIFFVNARIKKREAHKAAKKEKKKEDGSGEKKDGENKGVNENEKKNQA